MQAEDNEMNGTRNWVHDRHGLNVFDYFQYPVMILGMKSLTLFDPVHDTTGTMHPDNHPLQHLVFTTPSTYTLDRNSDPEH
ncbi:hypothetical protein Purlil1_4678 [Purpureocillium lilacinum]|uniref:Uncharacterized protein n=1 Tax=Purpureocillium lilacinum TaxID=33203 RepID=A0ABR0C5V3_PURLI|nr:hypothetical protein Purlil1_4678 [Purpureocillium lilacinum]